MPISSKQFLTENSIEYDKKTIKVGILTQPSRFEDKTYSIGYQYIITSYVKYLQQNNDVICLPIPFDSPKHQLKSLFKQVNALFFTGGMLNLESSSPPLSIMEFTGENQFLEAAKYLFQLAIESNDQGTYFPIWGTCQGFQLLQILANDCIHETLTPIADEFNVYNSVENVNKNSLLFSHMQDEFIQDLKDSSDVFYYHQWCVLEETYKKYSKLNEFFKITSTSTSKNGVQFIASIEGKKYPFFGVQFHPEIPLFEPKISKQNTDINQNLGKILSFFFINQIRNNIMTRIQQKKNALVERDFEYIQVDVQSQSMPNQMFLEIVFYQNHHIHNKLHQNNVEHIEKQVEQFDSLLLGKRLLKKKKLQKPLQIASDCVLNCIF